MEEEKGGGKTVLKKVTLIQTCFTCSVTLLFEIFLPKTFELSQVLFLAPIMLHHLWKSNRKRFPPQQ